MAVVKEKCVRILIEFQQMFSNLILKMGFPSRFSTMFHVHQFLCVCVCVRELFLVLFFILFPSSLAHLRFSLALRLSVCLSISHFSLSLSRLLVTLIAVDNNISSVLVFAFFIFFLSLLWWKELIFIYLLNVTHTRARAHNVPIFVANNF